MQEFSDAELMKTLISEKTFPPMEEGSTHQVIGKIPKLGDVITVNGLLFDVTFFDNALGKFTAKIKHPKE
jgi:Mg2+/Co2+ transporter CorC